MLTNDKIQNPLIIILGSYFLYQWYDQNYTASVKRGYRRTKKRYSKVKNYSTSKYRKARSKYYMGKSYLNYQSIPIRNKYKKYRKKYKKWRN